MIDYLSYLGLLFVIAQLFYTGQPDPKSRMIGFIFSIGAAFTWGTFGFMIGNFPIILMNVICLAIALKSFYNNYKMDKNGN